MIDLMVIVIFGIYLLGGILWYKYQDCGFYVFYFSQCQWDNNGERRWWGNRPARYNYVQTAKGRIPYTLCISKGHPISIIKDSYNKLKDLKEIYRTREYPILYSGSGR